MTDHFFTGATRLQGSPTLSALLSVNSNLEATNAPGPISTATVTVTAALGVSRSADATSESPVPAAATPYTARDQYQLAQQTYSATNIKQCGTCPQSIVNTIQLEVAESLAIVRRIKRLVTLLNRLLAAAEQGLLTLIDAFINLIPSPPVYDIREILGMLTCPLTPQAIAIGLYQPAIVDAHRTAYKLVGSTLNPAYYPALLSAFSANVVAEAKNLLKLDPKAYGHSVGEMWAKMVKDFWRQLQNLIDTENANDVYTGEAQRVYSLPPTAPEGTVVYLQTEDYAVQNLTDGQGRPMTRFARQRYVFRGGIWIPLGDSQLKTFMKTLFRLMDELWSAMKNVGYFAIRLSVTKGSVALVRATCPQVYETQWPFKQFDEEMRTFSMNGFLPSGLDNYARPFVDRMMRLQCKITQWQTASFVLLA